MGMAKQSRGLTVNMKLMLLFTAFASLFLAGIVAWRIYEQGRATSIAAEADKQRSHNIHSHLETAGKSLSDAALRNANDSELASRVASNNRNSRSAQDWFGNYSADILDPEQGLDMVWIYDDKGQQIYQSPIPKYGAPLPRRSDDLMTLFSPSEEVVQFFVKLHSGEFMEVRASKIMPTKTSSGKRSPGVLLIGRTWNDTFRKHLGSLSSAKVTVEPVGKESQSAEYVMKGIDNKAIANVHFKGDRRLETLLNDTTDRAIMIFVGFALTLLGVMFWSVFNWVGQPLQKISETLSYGDLTSLGDIERAGSEFEQLASLIAQFFLQRDALAKSRDVLEARVEERTKELQEAYEATIEGWSRALEFRDQETEGHCRRVTSMSVRLASEMGMQGVELMNMRRGALLHDIGKMGIPDSVLLKPGKLTPEERHIMEQHTIYAYQMLEPIAFLRPCLDVPLYHHEKWDGTGYPYRLRGEQIPLSARIFAVVDVWDALRSDRPYREAWSEERVTQYILENSGTHFDPRVVQAFLAIPNQDKLSLRTVGRARRAA